jgi:methionyl-tRNA synthetase
MINYEDFAKIEIKIGKVINAEKVPETDKLLKLEVDFGNDDIRIIVSGIAHVISPEDIVNKTLPFVTNLEPRNIRGIESQGMIMVAVDGDDNPVLLEPNKKIKPGSIVK